MIGRGVEEEGGGRVGVGGVRGRGGEGCCVACTRWMSTGGHVGVLMVCIHA